MNAVVAKEEALPPVQTYADGLLDVISRAARDPSVDIDKMERLVAMHERMQVRQAEIAYIRAMTAMQPELPIVTMRGKIIIRDKNDAKKVVQETAFGKLEDLQEAVKPVLHKHGFNLTFRNGLSEDGRVTVKTVVSHNDGHKEETMFTLPHDSTGSKNSVQAVGSSTSYGQRYGIKSLLNLTIAGEDDDGATADQMAVVSGEQLAELQTLADVAGADMRGFCDFMKVPSLQVLPATRFGEAKAALIKKAQRAASAAK
jgi:hypothetical protein